MHGGLRAEGSGGNAFTSIDQGIRTSVRGALSIYNRMRSHKRGTRFVATLQAGEKQARYSYCVKGWK